MSQPSDTPKTDEFRKLIMAGPWSISEKGGLLERFENYERQRNAARHDAERLAVGLAHMQEAKHHMGKPFDHLCVCAKCEDARKALAAHEVLWSTVDWSRPNTAIAAMLGCSHWTVGQYRRIYAPPTLPKVPTPWHTIAAHEWSLRSNASIAAELSTSQSNVAQHRRRNKLPHGPRSPGSGIYARPGSKIKPLTLHDRAKRLGAVWAYLWPDDPMNLRRLDEVAEIQTRTKP